jgi:hypothetical protein
MRPQSTCFLDWHDVHKLTGFQRSRAQELIREVNDGLKKQGYFVPKAGHTYIKAFAAKLGMTKDEVMEVIR